MTVNRHNKVWLIPLLTGTTMFYFLIFAQFGYLHLLSEGPLRKSVIDLVLMLMGLGGIIGSAYPAIRTNIEKSVTLLLAGYAGMGIVAYLSGFVSGLYLLGLVSLVMGFSLGLVTVTVVTLVRALSGGRQVAWLVSIGVGSAYFLCNLPFVFSASPWNQALLGTAACCIGIGCAMMIPPLNSEHLMPKPGNSDPHPHLFLPAGIVVVTILFTGLIWYDSAAFYLIQESESLRLAAWSGNRQLLLIGIVHLASALLSGKLLDKGWLLTVIALSTALLVFGYGMIRLSGNLAAAAGLIYASGVSLYSCALVSYGALAPERRGQWGIARRAGTVFAIAGWLGSGMGIGMAKDLQKIPLMFMVILLILLIVGFASNQRLYNALKPETR